MTIGLNRIAAVPLALLAAVASPGCGDDSQAADDGASPDALDHAETPADVPRPDDAADRPGDAPAPDDSGDDAGGADDASPPPECTPLLGSAYSLDFRPAEPWAAGAVRVSATGPDALTNVGVTLEPGGPASSWLGVDGTGPYTWSWSFSPLAAGDFCVVFAADPAATVYQRAPLHVAPAPPPSPAFQVATNHQWTCDEEYTWAINVDTTVLDETGAPLPDVRVLVEHDACETAADHPPPAEVVTGADGTVRWENYNPRCFFRERIADAPSDTAVEIYTGIWEDQDDGAGGRCNYCSTYAENVWGHWSYSLVFRRNPAATQLCEVPTDHAGQSHCSPTLHWLEPAACTPL